MSPSPLKKLQKMVHNNSKKSVDMVTSQPSTPSTSAPEAAPSPPTSNLAKLNVTDSTKPASAVPRLEPMLPTVSHPSGRSVDGSVDEKSLASETTTSSFRLRSLSSLSRELSARCADKKESRLRKKEAASEEYGFSGTQPSCELFSVFKALADSTPEQHDSDSDGDHTVASTVATTATDTTSQGHSTLAPAAVTSARRRESYVDADHLAALAAERDDEAAATKAAAAAGSDSEAVKRWLREMVEKNRTIAERYPVVSSSEAMHVRPRRKSEPAPAGTAEWVSEEEEDEWHNAEDVLESTISREGSSATASILDPNSSQHILSMSESDVQKRFRREHIPAERKLQVIQEEFGDIASRYVNDAGVSEPERIIAESQGSLFKGVMMIGNLHLTTHRIVFHALIPPDDMYSKAPVLPTQTEDEAAAKDDRPNVIIAGPVNIHRHNALKRQRRVWLELTPDMITSYPSADEAGRVRPIHSILSLKLSPFDESQPLDFYLKYWSSDRERVLHFTVDNESSGIRWRRHFESVLFRHARDRFRESHCRDVVASGGGTQAQCEASPQQWALIRCCVPLNRATLKGIGEYHSFATLINLQVSLEQNMHLTWHPEELARGNYGNFHKQTSGTGSGASTPTRSLSLRQALPSFKRKTHSRQTSEMTTGRSSSPSRASGLSHIKTDISDNTDGEQSASPTYLHFELPPRAHQLNRLSMQRTHRTDIAPTADEEVPADNVFDFLVAVLNEESWFASKVGDALVEAHKCHLKDGETQPKMVLDVGGYDCLAADDENDGASLDINSLDKYVEEEDDENNKPMAVIEASKAQKAAMAARVFGLREDEGIYLKRCYVQHNLLLARGHIIITPRFICFWRRTKIGSDIKYRFTTREVKGAEVDAPLHPGLNGMVLKVNGHHDLKFQLFNQSGRDELIQRINEVCMKTQPETPSEPGTPVLSPTTSGPPIPPERTVTTSSIGTASSEHNNSIMTESSAAPSTPNEGEGDEPNSSSPYDLWHKSIKELKDTAPDLQINPALTANGGSEVLKAAADILAPPPDMLLYPKSMSEQALSYMPFVANRPWGLHSGWNVRLTPRTFTMLTIGSRGDVQPYIALGLRLMQDGHKVVIVTHDEFKTWIESYGIEHRQAGGDPTALMKLSTDHKMFSPGFFKEALGGFRAWLDALLVDAWHACHDADVLIESPSAMAGVHIAEALKIPYFRAFTMPWTRTSAYPQAFMVPAFEMGPSFNYSTYVLFDSIMWRASSGQINRWRKKTLNLGSTDQSSLSISKVPFLYNFSPAVVPKPLDWEDDITITGYWNLENSDMDWSAPESLLKWMDKAKADKKAIVYIGFGSIVVPDPSAVTRSIIEGVEKADVRAIIAKGWSARDSKATDTVEFPPSCYSLDKVPHGWLFPKINAAMHHGGAGTTGASLRAGIPTLIKPWFGDQHFWALRVAKLEAGAKVASLRSDDVADALRKATTNRVMIEKAARIGERIRTESGVDAAVQSINFNLVRAAKNRNKLKKEDKKRAETSSGFPALSNLPTFPGISLPICKSTTTAM